MKKRIEKWAIRKLLNNSGFAPKDINEEKRTINFGLFGLNHAFCEPKHELYLAILLKWYKYKCYEERFVIYPIVTTL